MFDWFIISTVSTYCSRITWRVAALGLIREDKKWDRTARSVGDDTGGKGRIEPEAEDGEVENVENVKQVGRRGGRDEGTRKEIAIRNKKSRAFQRRKMSFYFLPLPDRAHTALVRSPMLLK